MSRKGYETLATNEDNTNQSFHPTKSANLLSLLTFWWMNNIFSKGNKRPLNQSDFLPLHEDDKARDLTERLQKEWNDQLPKWNNSQGKQPRLWRCVLRSTSFQSNAISFERLGLRILLSDNTTAFNRISP